MNTTQTLETEEQLDTLETYTSTGTTLISLYVPGDTSITQPLSKVQSEQSEAQNIKSKQTRNDVLDALSRIQKDLRQINTIPENGVALFAGNPRETTDTISMTITPDHPITSSTYHCGKSFNTEPLRTAINTDEVYAVILVDINHSLIATVNGSHIEVHKTFDSLVPGKQSKGGQSQQRFDRLRLEALHEFYKKTAKAATTEFSTTPSDLDGVIIGGPEHTRNEFIDEEYLHYTHQNNILYHGSVSSITETGVNELLESAQSAIEDSKISVENELIETFFSNIADNTATYGYDEVIKAGEYGAIDTVLLSKQKYKTLPEDDLQQLENVVEQYTGEIQILDCESDKGAQFKNGFDGLGAILRFPIN